MTEKLAGRRSSPQHRHAANERERIWQESADRHDAEHQEARLHMWRAHHQKLARIFTALAEEHEAAAEALSPAERNK